MVCDFGQVKKVMRHWLDTELDHRLAVPAKSPQIRIEDDGEFLDIHFAFGTQGEFLHTRSPRDAIAACEGGCFRFRLAGTGVRAAFGCEARGRSASEIELCREGVMWTELAARSLARLAPVAGRTLLPDGIVHYWLRLPMSSDGTMADLVLCHDRYLPADALDHPERAAREADLALRLDATELAAA
jgi:hypothetical protein